MKKNLLFFIILIVLGIAFVGVYCSKDKTTINTIKERDKKIVQIEKEREVLRKNNDELNIKISKKEIEIEKIKKVNNKLKGDITDIAEKYRKIQQKYSSMTANEKDKELEKALKRNNVENSVNSKENFLSINFDNRTNLFSLVIDYEKLSESDKTKSELISAQTGEINLLNGKDALKEQKIGNLNAEIKKIEEEKNLETQSKNDAMTLYNKEKKKKFFYIAIPVAIVTVILILAK